MFEGVNLYFGDQIWEVTDTFPVDKEKPDTYNEDGDDEVLIVDIENYGTAPLPNRFIEYMFTHDWIDIREEQLARAAVHKAASPREACQLFNTVAVPAGLPWDASRAIDKAWNEKQRASADD